MPIPTIRKATVRKIKSNGEYVPAVRLDGKWLDDYGFFMGDVIIVSAEKHLITIKKEV